MLAHLIEVQERIFQSPTDRGHSTERCALELLTLEERLCVFEESNIVARHYFDEVLCGGKLAESYAEVVGVVKGVEEILMERVDILEPGETVQDQRELFCESFLCEFDFSSIEV
jgi:hypothetical protein